ncbi:MAG: sulfite exporter TauE/SafE family protein [Magnetococcales bacterium]|nr:sulfite exporter TauE/SafE family protein [Magnetococcales bacterium]MBF0323185.1 sulfite exporter TauE/SafE family protein [Magnetococcales bacterium]
MSILVPGSVVVGLLGGYFAGFSGVGGGMVMVPALLLLFHLDGLAPFLAWQTAVGHVIATSVIIDLAVAGYYHRRDLVRWDLVRHFFPGILLGLLVGESFAPFLPGTFIEAGLAFLMMAMGLRMLQELPVGNSEENGDPDQNEAGLEPSEPSTGQGGMQKDDGWLCWLFGVGIGFFGGMFGIGGTILLVPTLIFVTGVAVHQAVATTAVTGFFLTLAGSTGLVNAGWHQEVLPPDTLGIMLPEVLLAITLGGLLAIPFGGRQGCGLSQQRLMQSLGVLLLASGVEVIWR